MHPRFFASLVTATLALASSASAGIVYVDANLTTGLDDGSSWANAFQGSDGLRRALLVAVSGDQVFAAQGTYLPTTTSDRTLRFTPADGIELYGGFVGIETSPAERPPFGSAPTVLSGDLNGDDPSTGDNTRGVVSISGLTRATVLDGLEIRGANNPDVGPTFGGGLTCAGTCSPTVRNCVIRDNYALSGGAFDLDSGSEAVFEDCVFENNRSFIYGGAGFTFETAVGSAISFDRCVFRGNSSNSGGGLFLEDAEAVITNCVFEGNTAFQDGGAVGANGSGLGNLRFRNNTVVGNVSGTPGALWISTPYIVTVANCIFWDNEGPGGSQSSADQISGTGATFSIVEGGLAGTGNLSADPQFAGAGDYFLTLASPGVDAGSNSSASLSGSVDLAGNPRFADAPQVPDTGAGTAPIVDMGALELVPTPVPTFCDASDGSLASCPCANPGAPESGCDNAQGTGGVQLELVAQVSAANNRTTMTGSGFPAASFPTSIVIRSHAFDPGQPVPLGDGLRCISPALVRLDARTAAVGLVQHTFGHGAMAGPGDFHYQLWFRNTPAAFCTPDAFNVSNGISLTW